MNDIKNWLPYKLTKADGRLQCHWFNTYGQPFIEPFFDDTILKCRTKERRNFTFSSVSDLEMMEEWARDLDAVIPNAFIFHISRCGSTLISQMLATSAENIVLAEVPFFDELLRLRFKDPGFDKSGIDELLLGAIKYHGQSSAAPGSHHKRVFIKTDSWHLFFYEQLRRLFPMVPFILMYRSPDEVFRSHRKQAGMQSVAGLLEPELFGISSSDIAQISPDIYLATVLENYLTRCFEISESDNNCLLINYNEGPIEILEKLILFTNINIIETDLQKMHNRSMYHSKKPGETFYEEKIDDTPPCLARAMKLYHRLEEKRKTR